jgi:hypothetical protein
MFMDVVGNVNVLADQAPVAYGDLVNGCDTRVAADRDVGSDIQLRMVVSTGVPFEGCEPTVFSDDNAITESHMLRPFQSPGPLDKNRVTAQRRAWRAEQYGL